MSPRRVRANAGKTEAPPPEPVVVRNVLEDLAPGLRESVLALAGGDVSRIRIQGPGRVEVLPASRR